jgi:hypothetical protein
MPTLNAKDRVSLCLFSYEDGRRCRTPRISSHPHFCFYHAQKESQSQSAEKLAKDLAYFFSGDYLSANDLNTALGRLIPAVVRGEIKPRVARTVASMLQTLLQSTRQAQHEYINAFSTDGWRDAISTSVNANHAYLHPPKPKQRPQSPVPSAGPNRAHNNPPPLRRHRQPAPCLPTPKLPSVSRAPSFPATPTQLPQNPNPPRPHKEPVILSQAKDPASSPPHRPPVRPASQAHPLHHLRHPNLPPDPATSSRSASPTPASA